MEKYRINRVGNKPIPLGETGLQHGRIWKNDMETTRNAVLVGDRPNAPHGRFKMRMLKLCGKSHRCGEVIGADHDGIETRYLEDFREMVNRTDMLDHGDQERGLRLFSVPIKVLAEEICT